MTPMAKTNAPVPEGPQEVRHGFTEQLDEIRGDVVRLAGLTSEAIGAATHCLLDADDHIWGIDNGLSFHREFKLRTVIWHFEGEPIPMSLLDDLSDWLGRDGPADLEFLDPFEVDAVRTRATALIDAGHFPVDESGHRHPWPLV